MKLILIVLITVFSASQMLAMAEEPIAMAEEPILGYGPSGSTVRVPSILHINFTLPYANATAFGRSNTTEHITTTGTASLTVTYSGLWGAVRYNLTATGYTNLATPAGFPNVTNFTSTAKDHEPFGIFNFTIPVPVSDINWINVTMSQAWALGTQASGETCRYFISNFTGASLWEYGAPVASTILTSRSVNITSGISNYIQDGRLSVLSVGIDMDADEGCVVDYVGIIVGYEKNITDRPPQYSLNSTSSTFAGTPVSHNLYWKDDFGLSGYIFSFDNCRGDFVNDTWVPFSGVGNWSNVTKITNSTAGCVVRWCVYANDTGNNWNSSCENPFSYVTRSVPTLLMSYSYYCLDDYSVERITTNETTYEVSIFCPYGCSEMNTIRFVQGRTPQGDICNPHPIWKHVFTTAVIIAICFTIYKIFDGMVVRKKPVAIAGVLATMVLFIFIATVSDVLMLGIFERILMFAFLFLLLVSFLYMLVVAE